MPMANAQKEMLAIIGILLFVSTSKQVTALRERNAAFYIQARMLQELQRRSRRLLAAERMVIRMLRTRKQRPRLSQKNKPRSSFAFRHLQALA